MNKAFPRTMVGGKSLSRMIIGSNWILGYSHTSPSADGMIKKMHGSTENIAALLGAYLSRGVDTIMAPFAQSQLLLDAIKMAEDKSGKGLILVDTPILNVDDRPEARREAEALIKRSAEFGATFCMPHHQSCEQLINKNAGTMDRLPDYLKMIRENGMIPGLSAHMPEVLVYADENEYDVETYIQIYNCAGFLMQVEIEYIHKVIHAAKKPVMTIKPMAAGRVSPFVGLTFSFATIRDCDMVAVGALTPEEALEDIEISLAALERRAPDIEGRNSPAKSDIMK